MNGSHLMPSMGARRLLAMSVLAASVLIAGVPAAASADALDHGSAATCRIRIVGTLSDGTPIGVLRRIVVTPPTMYGTFSFGSQPVGWRFVVYKSYRYWTGNPWTVYYKSPLQTGTASETQPADFSKMLVRLTAPSTNTTVQLGTAYRVEVRMFWWYPDGSLLHSRIDYLLPNLREVVDGTFHGLVMPCYYRYPYPDA